MISIQDLSFAFSKQRLVLQGITCRIPAGSCLCLAGGNGSGKSTLLALLAGLYTPLQGRINIFGVSSPGDQPQLRQLCAILLQDADLQILGGTVAEDILLGCKGDAKLLEQRARRLAKGFGLLKYWEHPVQQLSGGEKKKLCLAGALMHAPKLILFDEPFNNLDYFGLNELRQIMARQKEAGITQIISTHDLEPILDLADEIAVLEQGRLACKESPEFVLDQLQEFGVRTPCAWRLEKKLSSWG
ncbi:MAG: energy-coupling factor ABC transporter ATP-binding protein [Desulfohalobiaceae bacterium]